MLTYTEEDIHRYIILRNFLLLISERSAENIRRRKGEYDAFAAG